MNGCKNVSLYISIGPTAKKPNSTRRENLFNYVMKQPGIHTKRENLRDNILDIIVRWRTEYLRERANNSVGLNKINRHRYQKPTL